jgi:hypothetical protein
VDPGTSSGVTVKKSPMPPEHRKCHRSQAAIHFFTRQRVNFVNRRLRETADFRR